MNEIVVSLFFDDFGRNRKCCFGTWIIAIITIRIQMSFISTISWNMRQHFSLNLRKKQPNMFNKCLKNSPTIVKSLNLHRKITEFQFFCRQPLWCIHKSKFYTQRPGQQFFYKSKLMFYSCMSSLIVPSQFFVDLESMFNPR